WQEIWATKKLGAAGDFSAKQKYYVLFEFPYPSGAGLHVGHVRPYVGTDVIARFRRMQGYNVLYPIGWDAFGLPTENFAIKHKIHPRVATDRNIKNFKKQMKAVGISVDWDREIDTTDPKYYKWTQWIFLQLYKAGMAYRAEVPINWCPSCKTGLANEEVINGKHERCGTPVTEKLKKQWLIRITKYADRLIEDLKSVDFPERVKTQQINWIGRSEGVVFTFSFIGISGQPDGKHLVKVFTTRPDTLFGATFMAVSSELAKKWLDVGWQAPDAVKQYIVDALAKKEDERVIEAREKTGVDSGIRAIHPATKEEIPVWVADYVLGNVGTGAIMAVPAHDERDFAFAKKYGLPIKMVICPHYPTSTCPVLDEAYTGAGHLVDSEKFSGMPSEEAKDAITKFVNGEKKVQYRLRDWVFSRQRYWGEPIPIVYCKECGEVPVPEADLPVLLPDVKKYEPTETGESPLAAIKSFVETKCPSCGGVARRETDTMPNWAGSNWYFLRYLDPRNENAFADRKKIDYWMPVDLYNGGMEHTTLHLLYSRFIYKFLYDQGFVPHPEPYAKRTSHGVILAEDNRKMSKSFGNVINPDDIVKEYGADTLRMYEMFIAPFDQMVAWDAHGVIGVRRFLDRVWHLYEREFSDEATEHAERIVHKLIKKVGEDIVAMKFNTAVSSFMESLNALEKCADVSRASARMFCLALSPFAPHIAAELWEKMGEKGFIHEQVWPKYNEALIREDTFELVVQVNGKMRATILLPVGASREDAEQAARGHEMVVKYLEGKTPKKVVFVPNRLLNFVI
ncbi:MAG: leucine--tRNA ligase, partial [bacterium]|nr:leucine--tRNA ligase [bacterium]